MLSGFFVANYLTTLLQAGRRLIETSSYKRSGLVVALNKYETGSLISKFGRYIFEHKWVHRFLGSNLALAAVASSLLQTNPSSFNVSVFDTPNMVVKAEKINFYTERGIQTPLYKMRLNQGYGWFHPGVDLEGDTGDTVRPIISGTVDSIQYSKFAYGNSVVVNHGNGVTSLYAHLSKITVKPGDQLSLESKIGEVGSTGRSTGDHLHLEVREEGKALNPLTILPR